MKNIILFLAVFISAAVTAQVPTRFSYQTVVRDASGNLVVNQQVAFKFSILKTSSSGTAVYVETQKATTNANGLASIEVGSGTVVTGTMAGIQWPTDKYFLKTEADPAGGTSYTITGTSPMLSVPYATQANRADNYTKWNANGDKAKIYMGDEGQKIMGVWGVGVAIEPLNTTTPFVVQQGTGNVGIGSTNPGSKLFIEAGANNGFRVNADKGKEAIKIGGSGSFSMDAPGVGDGRLKIGETDNNGAFDATIGNFLNQCHLDLTGCFRITPTDVTDQAGIRVLSSNFTRSSTAFGFLNKTQASVWTSGSGTNNLITSIITANGIMSEQFWAVSDMRYKKNITPSNVVNDLATVNKLKVTDYRYIDEESVGYRGAKGFIAQELAQVIPNAVAQTKKYIPNIFVNAVCAEVVADGNVAITILEAHNLKEGDKVQLLSNVWEYTTVAKVVDANTFEVAKLNSLENVFVYGKQVNDFNVVNYEQIFSTGIGAIQALSQENDMLKTAVSSLQNDNAVLKASIEGLMEKMNVLSTKVSSIEHPTTGMAGVK